MVIARARQSGLNGPNKYKLGRLLRVRALCERHTRATTLFLNVSSGARNDANGTKRRARNGRQARNDEPQCATTSLARKNGPGARLAPDPFRAYATTKCPASHKYEHQAAFTRGVQEQPRPTVFFTK
jgi:hypothetical protein